jgi:GT2 family glycosyltransferase
LFFDRTFLVCGAGMVRRSALAQVQGFDPELRLMEDVDLYARIIRRFGAYYMDRVSLHYRIGPSLIHRSGVQPGIDESYRRIHAKYRNEWGRLQFFALKLFARTLLRMA